jgi:hypothetical protein
MTMPLMLHHVIGIIAIINIFNGIIFFNGIILGYEGYGEWASQEAKMIWDFG